MIGHRYAHRNIKGGKFDATAGFYTVVVAVTLLVVFSIRWIRLSTRRNWSRSYSTLMVNVWVSR